MSKLYSEIKSTQAELKELYEPVGLIRFGYKLTVVLSRIGGKFASKVLLKYADQHPKFYPVAQRLAELHPTSAEKIIRQIQSLECDRCRAAMVHVQDAMVHLRKCFPQEIPP